MNSRGGGGNINIKMAGICRSPDQVGPTNLGSCERKEKVRLKRYNWARTQGKSPNYNLLERKISNLGSQNQVCPNRLKID